MEVNKTESPCLFRVAMGSAALHPLGIMPYESEDEARTRGQLLLFCTRGIWGRSSWLWGHPCPYPLDVSRSPPPAVTSETISGCCWMSPGSTLSHFGVLSCFQSPALFSGKSNSGLLV